MERSRWTPLLLRWYRKHGRTLPWRKTQDPYKILVSEIMLQQTQVPRVLLFYKKWLKEFPSWKHLAEASNAEVIRAWAGLGYNRRALMLRDIAQEIVVRGVPTSESEWRSLKGIGPYTAAALTVFSLHKRAIPIDTNVRRVLGRVLLGIPYPNPTVDEKIRRRASEAFEEEKTFYNIPQALFDLANAHCKKVPDCASCPLNGVCPAGKKFLRGAVRVPRAMIKKPLERKHRNKPFPDRIYRGRILKTVREHPGIVLAQIGMIIDPDFSASKDQTWVSEMVVRLSRDGMLIERKGRLFLE